jgi:hypothetical protein
MEEGGGDEKGMEGGSESGNVCGELSGDGAAMSAAFLKTSLQLVDLRVRFAGGHRLKPVPHDLCGVGGLVLV